ARGTRCELLDWGWVEHFRCGVGLARGLTAGRIVELPPFGPQRRYGIAPAPDLGGELRDAFGLHGRFEFDLVNVDCRRHQRRRHDEMDKAHHYRSPRSVSPSEGSRDNTATGLSRAGASVRSAARSFAERARGFSLTSAASGVTGRRVSTRNVAACGALSGRWREPPPETLRAARNVLTIRSSTEWNQTTTSRPPGFKMRSAAARAASSS